MTFILKLVEFLLGATFLIAWVSLLGLALSRLAPSKIGKLKITRIQTIAIAGIGLFSTFLTLFFLFLAPKLGLAKLQMNNIFGSVLSGGSIGVVSRWGGRILLISCGVLASFIYATFFFRRLKGSDFLKGLSFGVLAFVAGTLLLFPLLSFIPGVQLGNISLPTFIGPLSGSAEEVMTLLAATLFFGALMSSIYHQWEEA